MKQTSSMIKRHIKARTPKGLERAMFLNNLRRKSYHRYDIVFDGKNWVAWYDCDLSGMANVDMIEVSEGEDGAI